MLFVYGTLQDPDRTERSAGEVHRSVVAPGFRAVAYPGRVYPALVKAPDDAAPWRVIDGLDANDTTILDAFEGEEYSRSMIEILVDNQASGETYRPTISVSARAPAPALIGKAARLAITIFVVNARA